MTNLARFRAANFLRFAVRIQGSQTKKSPRPCDLGLNPPKEEGGGDNLGKTNGQETQAADN
jgi:hypothetical protein